MNHSPPSRVNSDSTEAVLRGAFIGFGNVAVNGHMPGWHSRQDIKIVAATDAVCAREAAFLEACSDGRWYESVDELLSGETLDFVDICTPPSSHSPLIKRALDAKLHVLCEKPLVIRADEALPLAAAASSSRRVVHTVHNWLQAPICLKISALINEGAIGAVRFIRWRTLRTQPAVAVTPEGGKNWRVDPAIAGGGILFDHGWHALYCIMRWAGKPLSVAALLENRRFHEWPLEDTATVTLHFASGSAQIHLSWASERRANYLEIEGERGRIEVTDADVVVRSGSGERRWSCPPSLSEGSHHRDWFIGVAEEFRNAVAGRGDSNLDQAILCAQLIDLAQRSSAAGGNSLPVAG
jgi:predicted dehydrogenase